MRFRFTLTHNLQLPSFAQNWVTRAGNTPWTIDNSPSVTVSALDESIIETEFVIAPGLYEINYDVTLSDTGILELTFDKTNHSVSVGSGNTGSLSAGNSTGTFYITVTDYGEGAQIGFADLSSNSNTITINSLRFVNAGHEISEPDGWKDSVIRLERHKDFHSLIEYFDGGSDGAFIFYGQNEDVDGGINFIREIDSIYGVDATLEFLVEFSPDDISFTELFNGLLDLSTIEEMVDNKMQVAAIRNNFWAPFINRLDTPVDIKSDSNLNDSSAEVFDEIMLDLPSQKTRKSYSGTLTNFFIQFEGSDWTVTRYVQLDMDNIILDEIDTKSIIPSSTSGTVPVWLFEMKEDGECAFDLRIESSARVDAPLNIVASAPYITWYIQFGSDAPIAFSEATGGSGSYESTVYTYNQTVALILGTTVRIYGDIISDIAPLGANAQYFIWSTQTTTTPSGAGTVNNPPTYFKLDMDTTYQQTQGQAFLVHDVGYQITDRIIGVNNSFYSEFLGSTITQCRQYIEDGCGWMYAIIKGLQLRQYTLTEKPFFMSFNTWWKGISPILSLGLSYETIDGNEVIRVEELKDFFDVDTSINFSNVREIKRSYDNDRIFKTIKTGYKKWQSEDVFGIDDPQTKHTRATKIQTTGVDLDLESEFIAAGLAIEKTRRTRREQSADYKYDNEPFIIALREDDVSPDRYTPELDENFDSITNLLNSDTRYNLILTPLRNFLRWIPFINGCLQSYPNSKYKFVSGEGNYDMVSDYSCASGNFCQSKSCDPRSEKMDVAVNDDDFGPGTGQEYLHVPLVYDMKLPMEWEEYETIRNNRKKAIGISQTDTGHQPFFIKDLAYSIVEGTATIKAWPKAFFEIEVIDQEMEMTC